MLASGQYRIYPTPPQPGPTSKVIHVNLPNTLKKGTQKSIKSLKFHNGKKGDSQFQVTVTGGLDSAILQHKDALKLAYYNRHTAPEQELNISKK